MKALIEGIYCCPYRALQGQGAAGRAQVPAGIPRAVSQPGHSQTPQAGSGIFVPPGMLREHSGNVYGLKAAELLCSSQSFPHSHRERCGNLWLERGSPVGPAQTGYWDHGEGGWNSCGIPGVWRSSGCSQCSIRDKTGNFSSMQGRGPIPILCQGPIPKDFILGPLPAGGSGLGLSPLSPPAPPLAPGGDRSGMWPLGTPGREGKSRLAPGRTRRTLPELLQERGAPERSRIPPAQQRHYESKR